MLPETDLLSNIIQAVPDGTAWIISNDSWDLIPEMFHTNDFNENYWVVNISEECRQSLIERVIQYDLSDKIVHMDLIIDNKVLFNSYDRMSMITIDCDFEKKNDFIKKHSELDIYT